MPGLMSGDWNRSTVSGPQRLQPVRGQRRTYRPPRQPSTPPFYVLEGTLAVRLDVEQREVTAGSLVWIPRGTPHAFANAGGSAIRPLGLAVPGGLEALLAEQQQYFDQLEAGQIWRHAAASDFATGLDCWVLQSRFVRRSRESPEITLVDLVLSISGLLVGAVLPHAPGECIGLCCNGSARAFWNWQPSCSR